jgi:hypothetical protein
MLKRNAVPIGSHSCTSSQAWHPPVCFLSLDWPVMDISYNWRYVVRSLLCLASPGVVFKVHPHVGCTSSRCFLWLSILPAATRYLGCSHSEVLMDGVVRALQHEYVVDAWFWFSLVCIAVPAFGVSSGILHTWVSSLFFV